VGQIWIRRFFARPSFIGGDSEMECWIDGAIGLEFCIDRYYMFYFLFVFYDFPWGTKVWHLFCSCYLCGFSAFQLPP
jgi:hypothetical protein